MTTIEMLNKAAAALERAAAWANEHGGEDLHDALLDEAADVRDHIEELETQAALRDNYRTDDPQNN